MYFYLTIPRIGLRAFIIERFTCPPILSSVRTFSYFILKVFLWVCSFRKRHAQSASYFLHESRPLVNPRPELIPNGTYLVKLNSVMDVSQYPDHLWGIYRIILLYSSKVSTYRHTYVWCQARARQFLPHSQTFSHVSFPSLWHIHLTKDDMCNSTFICTYIHTLLDQIKAVCVPPMFTSICTPLSILEVPIGN